MNSLPSLSPQILASIPQAKLRRYLQTGLEQGCPHDQLLNFCAAGIVLQVKQLAASAAARLCDRLDGPKAVGYGGARGGGTLSFSAAAGQDLPGK